MCLPFHLYACSKPSLFWFQVIKINWTFNLISKPCPFLCLSRVGDGQLISKGDLKVFSIFLLTQTNPWHLYLGRLGTMARETSSSFFTLVKQCDLDPWFSVLVVHGNHLGGVESPGAQSPPRPMSIRIPGGGVPTSGFWKVIQVVLVGGPV